MIKFTSPIPGKGTLVGLVLEPENLVRIQGDPVFVDLADLGIEGVSVLIGAGDKQQVIEKLKRHMTVGEIRDEDGATEPAPKLYPDDQGGLATACYIKDDQIVLNFGKPVSWLSMHKSDAEAMIAALQQKVAQL